jgi:hypothetical protein
MSPHPFRFGVVAISAAGGKEWTATAQWAEDAAQARLPRYDCLEDLAEGEQ